MKAIRTVLSGKFTITQKKSILKTKRDQTYLRKNLYIARGASLNFVKKFSNPTQNSEKHLVI